MRLLLFIGPIALAVVFRLTQKDKKGGLILFAAWLGVAVLSVILGALLWSPSDESTQFAAAALLASPVILLGPLLLALRTKSVSSLVLGILTFAVPIASVAAVAYLLMISKQIWGM